MANDSYGFLGGTSVPSAKFPTKGASVSGVITDEPVVSQQTDLQGNPKTWDDGNPMMQLVVTLQTDEHDSDIEDDTGLRRVFIKGAMRTAVQKAIREAGSKGLDVGASLTITYTHDGERKNPGFSPPKQYSAKYVAGATAAQDFSANNGVATDANRPSGISADEWAKLSPEAQAALGALAV